MQYERTKDKMSVRISLLVILGFLATGVVCQESPQLVVLVADFGLSNQLGAIYKLNIHHMDLITLPISNVSGPVAIDYDKRNNYIYWTDIVTKQVRRVDIDGGNDHVVASLNSTSSPEGLTLDSITGQVFYTDKGNGVIVRIEMSNFQSTTIINTGLDKPRGIVADTRNRKLYWGDRGNDPKIEICNYIGGERETFVSSGLVAPNGVALDEQADRLFWTDASIGYIASIFLNGTDRKILESLSGIPFWDISLFGGFLYFTVMEDSGVNVKTVGLDHRSSLTSVVFQNPAGIHAFSPNIDTASSCPYGQYGLTCAKCGNCSSGGPCEKTTGICLGGCEIGFKGEMCTEVCDPGTFGKVCDSICSKNCKSGSVCDYITGHCLEGCKEGWTGSNCTNACPDNTYGACIPCGHCAGGSSCDSVTGFCAVGCQTGWIGNRCNIECPPNTYGACTPCGHCAGYAPCDTVSGYCAGGCQLRWTGHRCDTECPSNTYGACIQCGRCAGGASCDAESGNCADGCKPGYTGEKCDLACSSKTYGACMPCGQCAGGASCDVVSGNCDGGCQPGWTGNRCDLECNTNTYGACIPCGHCAGGASCDVITGYCARGCQTGWKGNRCDEASPAGNDEQTGGGETNGATGTSIALIVGVVAGVTVVLIVVILVVAVPVIRKRRTSRDDPEPNAEFDSRTNDSVNDGYMTLGNLGTTGMLGPQHHRPSGTLGDAFTSRDDPEPNAEFDSRTNDSVNDGYLTLGNLGTTGMLGPQHHRPSGTLGDAFTSRDDPEPNAEFDSRTNDSVNDGYLTLGNLGTTGMLGPQHHRPSGTLGDAFTSRDDPEPYAEFDSRTNDSVNDGYLTLGNLGTTGMLGPQLHRPSGTLSDALTV